MKNDSKINWMRGYCGITKIISDYIRVFPIYLVAKYIDSVPLYLSLKCRWSHCNHCILYKAYKSNLDYMLRHGPYDIYLLKRARTAVTNIKFANCTSNNLQCENCPNFYDRKEWIRLFRILATNYGLKVC